MVPSPASQHASSTGQVVRRADSPHGAVPRFVDFFGAVFTGRGLGPFSRLFGGVAMNATTRPIFLFAFPLLLLAVLLSPVSTAKAGPKPESYWNVDDVRAGMKGQGRTVMRGTKIETFDAEVLGVLKNTSPGRDLVLCRLSGLNLDKTGVIAGMSGSPVYIDNKLLGAVAYAWAYGKEPIAGITPFSQMHGFVEAYERRDLAEEGQANRVGLAQPLRVGGRDFDSVTVSQGYDE